MAYTPIADYAFQEYPSSSKMNQIKENAEVHRHTETSGDENLQIQTGGIEDQAITDAKVKSDAAIAESKLTFDGSGHGHTGAGDGKVIARAALADDIIDGTKLADDAVSSEHMADDDFIMNFDRISTNDAARFGTGRGNATHFITYAPADILFSAATAEWGVHIPGYVNINGVGTVQANYASGIHMHFAVPIPIFWANSGLYMDYFYYVGDCDAGHQINYVDMHAYEKGNGATYTSNQFFEDNTNRTSDGAWTYTSSSPSFSSPDVYTVGDTGLRTIILKIGLSDTAEIHRIGFGYHYETF